MNVCYAKGNRAIGTAWMLALPASSEFPLTLPRPPLSARKPNGWYGQFFGSQPRLGSDPDRLGLHILRQSFGAVVASERA
jgi:hypothetical protein